MAIEPSSGSRGLLAPAKSLQVDKAGVARGKRRPVGWAANLRRVPARSHHSESTAVPCRGVPMVAKGANGLQGVMGDMGWLLARR